MAVGLRHGLETTGVCQGVPLLAFTLAHASRAQVLEPCPSLPIPAAVKTSQMYCCHAYLLQLVVEPGLEPLALDR